MSTKLKVAACDYLAIPILSGFAAGICISIGGLLNILMLYVIYDASKANLSVIISEIIKFCGAYFFSAGFLLVCLFNFQLYTGKIGKIFENQQSLQFYSSLPLILVGNTCGAIGIGTITYAALFKR